MGMPIAKAVIVSLSQQIRFLFYLTVSVNNTFIYHPTLTFGEIAGQGRIDVGCY